MTLRSFSSFDALRHELSAPTPGAEASEVLRVTADIHADDATTAAQTCRTMALEWMVSRFPDALPPEASRFETFALQSGSHAIEGARIRTDGDDVWAARRVHPSGSGPEGAWVTEVGVRAQVGRFPEFRLRLLRERRPPVPDDGPRVPDLVAKLASVLDLRRGGRAITTDPWLVDSESAAHRLCQELASPERQLPWLVLSVPEDAGDPDRPLLDPVAMARATAGLAVVVVLRADFTWTVTRTFDKQRSVYLGAVRLYLPGFSSEADPREHRLILFDWMNRPGGLTTHRDELLRRIAEHSLTGPGAWSFAQFRELVSQTEIPPAPPSAATDQAPPARPEPADRPSVEPASPPAPPPQAEPPAAAADPEAPEGAAPKPEARETEADVAPPAAPQPGWWGDLLSRGGAAWRALRGIPDPEVERARESLRLEVAAAKRRLRESDELRREQEAKAKDRLARARSDRTEYERYWDEAEQRVDEAVRERDLAVAELQRLRDQVVALGGRPSAPRPLPSDWSEFTPWCEAELTGRVRLLPRARREVKKARFGDVELAARCLLWLGGTYRRLRLEASGRGLKETLENGVHNQPCGGDAFTVKWRGRSWRVDWHIKSGGSTHDPTRCLRIYYFWDSSSSEVVVASMPAHIRTDAT